MLFQLSQAARHPTLSYFDHTSQNHLYFVSLLKPITSHLSPLLFISFVSALNVSLPPGVSSSSHPNLTPTDLMNRPSYDIFVKDKHTKQDQPYLLPLKTSFQVTYDPLVTPFPLGLVSPPVTTNLPHCTGTQPTILHHVLRLS